MAYHTRMNYEKARSSTTGEPQMDPSPRRSPLTREREDRTQSCEFSHRRPSATGALPWNVAALPAGAAQYTDKEDKNTNYITEPVLPPGTTSVQSQEGDYPYWKAPAELLPYRNIVPYYRYWLARLPFRGPGRNYPAPPELKASVAS